MISFLLTTWWIYIPIVAVLLYLTWQNRRKVKLLTDTNHVLLVLEIPRANDKKELAAEQMFASLHGILRSKGERRRDGGAQEHISYEIASIGNRIRFYVWVPEHLRNFVEGQIYAQYSTVQIHEADEDYANRDFSKIPIIHTAEITLTDHEALPIKTFPSFEVDPLAAITATLSKLEGEGEEMWIQVLARPIDDNWHKKSARFISKLRSGGGSSTTGWLGSALGALWAPPEEKTSTGDVSERDKSRITAAEEKSRKLGYQVRVRMAYLGSDRTTARLRMQAMVGTFKQFNSTNLNGFKVKNPSFDPIKLAEYKARFFIDKGFIFNIEELASLYHLPHTTVETPNIVWAEAKTAEPPATLPVTGGQFVEGISPFGITNFRGSNMQFGIKRVDRGRHMYIIGQTGTGKSGLLTLLTLSDIFHNQGFAIVDPHGDYATDIMQFIPESRVKDVTYFNPADMEYPIGFNPMEVYDQNMKGHTSSELVGVLKRMFDSWGPRLEYILRYTILALLDTPGTTMLDITRMLTDVKFRKEIVDNITDIVVKQFWTIEFASWNEKFATEAVAPILNKVGAFVANPMVRNIIGQPKSTFNVRQIMDEGKILIVNLSKGLMGEDNAAIMGALMVTKIQLSAMSRADIPRVEDRKPFYLYVDEFQNFATDSFAVILSEARKYGLNLTVANQYISQMPPEVKDAVFGNVGSMVVMRVGAEDGSSLVKYFEPHFESQDILQQNNFHFIATMAIDGEKTQAFSGKTLRIPKAPPSHFDAIVEHSRQLYSVPKAQVAAMIEANAQPPEAPAGPPQQQSRPIDPTTGEPAKKKTRRGSRGGKKKTDSPQSSGSANPPSNELNIR
ncbi:ATP-binding protein [Candidatus Saccharibacteria bacterium]|nr:ATP-binding protein [Candidatus Saccharibacteria bacterium]